MYKFKLLKPLSASSLIWALLVTAAVLLIATGANAQVGGGTSASTEPDRSTTVPTPPIPQIPDNADLPTNPPPTPTEPPVPDAVNVSDRTVPPPPTPQNLDTANTPTSDIAPTDPSLTVVPTAPVADLRANRSAEVEARLSAIEERRAAIEAKRQALQSASSTRQSLLPGATQQRALDGMARVSSTLSASINRSKDLIVRLRARITELSAAGFPTDNVMSTISQAEGLLEVADQALRDMDINARYAVTSDQPRADWVDVREQFQTVRQSIKDAHQLLLSAVFETRGLTVLPDPSPLPSEPTNPDQQ